MRTYGLLWKAQVWHIKRFMRKLGEQAGKRNIKIIKEIYNQEAKNAG